jgi:hypothetical protein
MLDRASPRRVAIEVPRFFAISKSLVARLQAIQSLISGDRWRRRISGQRPAAKYEGR